MDISSMLEVEVEEVPDENNSDGVKDVPSEKQPQKFPCQNYSKEEDEFYNLTYGSDVATVRFLRIHCTGCEEHIGSAPSEAHNIHEHPVLRVLLCAKCRDFYGDGTFEQGEDATDMFCRWCANGGELYCCSHCSNTFCSNCIQRNFDPPTIKRIEDDENWKCFVCDPKDLYPLRGIVRALISHVATVTKILESDTSISPKEKEEKMHLDETKCCSRKRKRRRKRTLSLSDDEEQDTSYTPEIERSDTPPVKKRKSRCSTVRNVFSNGYLDHEYDNSKETPTKTEPELDPADLIMSCEQTMVEGDTEILNPSADDDDSCSIVLQPTGVASKTSSTQPKLIRVLQTPKGSTNNLAINPVPLANLLKVALSTGAKKIKVTHSSNQKLVAVPMSMMPKAVASSSITFVKPSTHFLVPKDIAKSMQQQAALRKKQEQENQQRRQQPNVIDLDSDEEPVVLENNNQSANTDIIIGDNDDIEEVDKADEELVLPESDVVESNGDDELMVISENESIGRSTRTSSRRSPTVDGIIPLKIQQRDQRFKKMLVLQSQEIDNTLGELKTKVLKLVQLSTTKPGQDEDLLSSAALCTKRFHRAMRKALVELSIINDRLVKDYVHWKKRAVEKTNTNRKSQPKDDLPLEMICVRDSASESEMDDDDDDIETTFNEDRVLEATDMPPDFTAILDHLTIFKRKLTSVKGVGDSSVDVEDKACQADDVPWRDYEKCIGYSLLTRSEFDEKTQDEVTRPVVVQDENFGKYQEQFMFYLQHIEDHGIETDEMKGLPDPNHIPLKDLIDGTSPFITDMLERLSPVTLSNGCTSPIQENMENYENEIQKPITPPLEPMDTSLSPDIIEQNANSQSPLTKEDENDGKTAENTVPTSKAVEELVKMVTKLSEDLRTEQNNQTDEIEHSITDKECSNVEMKNPTAETNEGKKIEDEEQKMDDEVASLTVVREEDSTVLD